MKIEDRQRTAECGCHYDIKTSLITHYCDNLATCEFKEERISIIKATQHSPGIGHIIAVK